MILRTLVANNDKYNRINIQTTADNCLNIAISKANEYASIELIQEEIDELILLLTEAKQEIINEDILSGCE